MARRTIRDRSDEKPRWAWKEGRRVVRPARLSLEKLELLARNGFGPLPPAAPSLDAVLRSIDAKLARAEEQAAAPARFATVAAVCRHLTIGKTKLYELVPALMKAGIAIRVPPPRGPLRIDLDRLVAWLHAPSRRARKDR